MLRVWRVHRPPKLIFKPVPSRFLFHWEAGGVFLGSRFRTWGGVQRCRIDVLQGSVDGQQRKNLPCPHETPGHS